MLEYLRTVQIPRLDPLELQTLRNTYEFAKVSVYPESGASLIGFRVVKVGTESLSSGLTVRSELAGTPLVYADEPGRWIDKEDRSFYFLPPDVSGPRE